MMWGGEFTPPHIGVTLSGVEKRRLTRMTIAALTLALAGLVGAQIPFSEAQAQRGAEAYAASCTACHGQALEGMASFPALAGDSFMAKWQGKPVADLHAYIMANMPLGQGGSLTEQQYLDILAHILASNDFEAGDEELTAEAVEGAEFPAN